MYEVPTEFCRYSFRPSKGGSQQEPSGFDIPHSRLLGLTGTVAPKLISTKSAGQASPRQRSNVSLVLFATRSTSRTLAADHKIVVVGPASVVVCPGSREKWLIAAGQILVEESRFAAKIIGQSTAHALLFASADKSSYQL